MDSRNFSQPSAPPPPYHSVVNENRQSSYPESRQERLPSFDQFINRYESDCVT